MSKPSDPAGGGAQLVHARPGDAPDPTHAQVDVQGDVSSTELAETAIHKFLLLHRHLRQYALQMDDHGVRPREFSILLFLLENGPAPMSRIQEYLHHSPSTTSTILAQMEEAGYVARTRSEADNRVVITALTAAGRALAEQGPMGGIPLLRRRLPSLAPERLATMIRALDDMMLLMDVPETE